MIFDEFQIMGWIGVFILLLSYTLFTIKTLKKDYVLYHLLNLIGFILLSISTFVDEAWPALAFSLIFVGISVLYIVKILSIKPKYREYRIE